MLQHEVLKDEIHLFDQTLNYFNSFPQTKYQNTKQTRQAAVVMLFRFNPKLFERGKVLKHTEYDLTKKKSGFLNLVTINNEIKPRSEVVEGLEVMFIVRATHPKDRHSGQIAFPGGKCDGDENDFVTAIREVEEEVGLNLKDINQYAYLGKLNKNFYGYTTQKGRLNISVHMFLQLDLSNTPLRKNPSEVAEIFWLPLRFFLNSNLQTFQSTKLSGNLVAALPQGKLLGPLVQRFTKGLEGISYKQFLLPNNAVLWGLTLSFALYFLNVILDVTKASAEEFKTINLQNLEYIVKNGLEFTLVYNEDVMSKARHNFLRWIYYKVRIQQFELHQERQFGVKHIAVGALAVGVPLFVLYCRNS